MRFSSFGCIPTPLSHTRKETVSRLGVEISTAIFFSFPEYVAGLEHLLNRAKQSVSIFEHDAVEITPLGLVQSTAFERFQVQANRRDRRLQFVGNCIQEAVLLFISADLADKENRIHDQASDQQSKQNDAEDQRNNLAPVEDHPADVESRCQRDEAGT